MKRISYWARNHKWPARIIIVLSFALLSGLGIITGHLLYELNVLLPFTAFGFFVLLYFSGFVYYPQQADRKRLPATRFYRRQKGSDLMLATAAFCLTVFLSNQYSAGKSMFLTLQATTAPIPKLPKDSLAKTYKPIAAFSASMKDEKGKTLKWHDRKKLLKEQVQGIKKADDLSKGEKAVLIILSVIVALGLLLLLSGLACSLSCNGADGAALLVGIGGAALIIFLLVITIRAINGKKKKLKLKEEPPVDNF